MKKGLFLLILLAFVGFGIPTHPVPLAHSAGISIEAKNTQTFNLNTYLPADGDTVDLLVSVNGYNDDESEIQFINLLPDPGLLDSCCRKVA